MAKLMGRLAALGAARKYAERHSDQVHGGIDKVAGMVRGRAGQHGDKVDKAASMLKKAVTGESGDRAAKGRSGEARRPRSAKSRS